MFTGLVEETGVLRARSARGPGARLTIGTTLGPLALGESVAVQGACLTVQAVVSGGFEADVSAETLACTTLGALPLGAKVHLERAMPLGGRMGGHLVTGHVDGKIRLVERRQVGDGWALSFQFEPALARFFAPKGSECIDGISLTVNGVAGDRFDVMIVPHTFAVTAIGDLGVGGEANVEVDLMARYVARILEVGTGAAENTDERNVALYAKLRSSGYA